MDKYFLLTYAELGEDGFLHSRHAWFKTEIELQEYAKTHENIEIDLAIEILSCKEIEI